MDQDEPKKKTIDERLESLHASCQELHVIVRQHSEQMKKTHAREQKHRHAVLAAMKAYLEALNGGKDAD